MLLNFGVDTFLVICLQVLIDQTILITRKHFFRNLNRQIFEDTQKFLSCRWAAERL